jgi:two-component system, NarL family, invasion response regulator UvrY
LRTSPIFSSLSFACAALLAALVAFGARAEQDASTKDAAPVANRRGQSASNDQPSRREPRGQPDVIIVDLAMRTGALGGLSFIRRLRLHDQETPILVFTMHSDPVIVSRALEMGATGYVLKDTAPDEMLKAFRKVRENRPYLSHNLASEVAFMEARGTTNPLRRMTVRELQTLALVAEGKPYGVIAEHLHVSYKTVANTCTQLKAKLGVRTLPELMRIAIQHLPSVATRTR